MTAVKEPVDEAQDEQAHRWLTRSWLMVPAYVLVGLAIGFFYQLVLAARGQPEGDLLATTEDFAGVALEAGFALQAAAAPVAGTVLAVRALRRHVSRSAQAAFAVNGLLALLVLYQFVDAIRMSFFAPLD